MEDDKKVESSVIQIPCGLPAPIATNGSYTIGCTLPKNHEGQHEVTIKWEC